MQSHGKQARARPAYTIAVNVLTPDPILGAETWRGGRGGPGHGGERPLRTGARAVALLEGGHYEGDLGGGVRPVEGVVVAVVGAATAGSLGTLPRGRGHGLGLLPPRGRGVPGPAGVRPNVHRPAQGGQELQEVRVHARRGVLWSKKG